MFRRLLNLPITVASKAAKAFQDRQDARTKEKYQTVHDPGSLEMRAGPELADPGVPEESASMLAMDVVTVQALLGQKTPVAFVDVRPEASWKVGTMESVLGCAISMPEDTVGIRVSELPTDHMVIVLCDSGRQSLGVTRFFRERGMEDTWYLAGGIGAWQKAGGTLVPGKAQ